MLSLTFRALLLKKIRCFQLFRSPNKQWLPLEPVLEGEGAGFWVLDELSRLGGTLLVV